MDIKPLPRRILRVVQRAQGFGVAINSEEQFFLPPHMITSGDDVSSAFIKFLADLVGDADAVHGVLTVYDDDIGFQLRPEFRKVR